MASSDLYIFDGSFSSSDMFSSGTTTTDLFCNNELYSVDESLNIFDHFTPHTLSSSLPSDLLGTLTLSPQIPTGLYSDFSDGVKTEQFYGGSDHKQKETVASMARSYSAVENAGRYMQRSFSTNSVDRKPNQIPFNNVPIMDSLNLHFNGLKSPENDFFSGQMMRRVYTTGDLQVSVFLALLFLFIILLKVLILFFLLFFHRFCPFLQNPRKNVAEQRSSEPFQDEQNVKVGRYSAEERKEKISKYRAKRNHRNFTKTIKVTTLVLHFLNSERFFITLFLVVTFFFGMETTKKYACRKTLADSRPRIRGRFARNDEVVEIPNIEDDTELWVKFIF